MIQIDPKIMQIEGFDQNCLWVMCKMVDIMKRYKKNKFKRSTIAKYTGWGLQKVDSVLAKLEELKILEIQNTYKEYGGKGANEYKILTGFIYWVGNMQGETLSFEDREENDTIGENQTTVTKAIDDVLKSDNAIGENQTTIKNNVLPNILNSLSNIKSDLENSEKEKSTLTPLGKILKDFENGSDYESWRDGQIKTGITEENINKTLSELAMVFIAEGKNGNPRSYLISAFGKKVPTILQTQILIKKAKYYDNKKPNEYPNWSQKPAKKDNITKAQAVEMFDQDYQTIAPF